MCILLCLAFFRVLLLERFIHVLVSGCHSSICCVWLSFIQYYHVIFCCVNMSSIIASWLTCGLFPVWYCYKVCRFKHACSCPPCTLHTFLLHIYPGMWLLGYREAISSTSVKNVKPFSNVGKAIITTSSVQGFQGFHTRTTTLNIGIFSFRYLVSQSGFSLVFSDTK